MLLLVGEGPDDDSPLLTEALLCAGARLPARHERRGARWRWASSYPASLDAKVTLLSRELAMPGPLLVTDAGLELEGWEAAAGEAGCGVAMLVALRGDAGPAVVVRALAGGTRVALIDGARLRADPAAILVALGRELPIAWPATPDADRLARALRRPRRAAVVLDAAPPADEELLVAVARLAADPPARPRPRERVVGLVKASLRGGLRRRLAEDRDLEILARSRLFDAEHYLAQNPDVQAAGIDPLAHYVRSGAAEGRSPNPAFDAAFYLAQNPDVRQSGRNPFAHFLEHGAREGRVAAPGAPRGLDGLLRARLRVTRARPRATPPPVAADPEPPGTPSFTTPATWLPWLKPAERLRLVSLVDGHDLRVPSDAWPQSPRAPRERLRLAWAGLPVAHEPDVTLVVAVRDARRTTLACLESLATWPHAASFEVLVGDDGSTDGTAELLADLPGLRVLRSPEPQSVVATRNRAAGEARGRLLVFLDHDTVVLPGWLDALVATFTAEPDAGLVGSRLLSPDGSLREAGGIVWADGSAEPHGRHSDPEATEFGYLRDADYGSGAALAIPTALWRELGGFDESFRPGAYADIDLAFRVRAAGRRVLYQPEAAVLHLERERLGEDAAQATNRAAFVARWREALVGHGLPGDRPRGFAERTRRGRILYLDLITPEPDHHSGAVDAVNLLRLLRRDGYHVTFGDLSLHHPEALVGPLRAAGIECPCPNTRPALEAVCRRQAPIADAIILSREPVAADLLPLLRRVAPRVPIIFNTVDLHFLRAEREAELAGDDAARARAAATRRRELASIAAADATVVVSLHEEELLRTLAPNARVRRIPILRMVPPGPFAPWADRDAVTFVGGALHSPNRDAVDFLLREVWPRVRARGLAAPLRIVGADPPWPSAPEGGVEVVGHVADLAAELGRARITVAPLRVGAGIKGKVVDSLLHGVPVVATPLAVEGSGLRHDEHLLVAETADGLADAIVALYHTRPLWERLATAGRSFCAATFSVDAVAPTVRALLAELGVPRAEVRS